MLIAAGIGLVLVGEFAYAKVWPFDPNAPRWNTIYKLYHATWVLWGVAGGVAVASVAGHARAALRDPTGARLDLVVGVDRRALSGVAALGVASLLLVGTAVFPAFALTDRANLYPHDDPVGEFGGRTLDGTAYVNGSHPDAGAAIAWLDRVEGQPNVVTAPGTTRYTWVNAPSSLAGIATLAGWNHERGYRGDAAYERRLRAVETIYEGNRSAVRRLLRRYDVRYVYVGPNERERYEVRDPARIDGIEVAFRHGDVTIYAVTDGLRVANASTNATASGVPPALAAGGA